MKLRLENGNFKMAATVDESGSVPVLTFNNLPKGLTAEDFLGCVVEAGISFSVITTAVNNPFSNNVIFDVAGTQYFYNPLTGEVTTTAEGTDIHTPSDSDDPVNPGDGGDDTAA